MNPIAAAGLVLIAHIASPASGGFLPGNISMGESPWSHAIEASSTPSGVVRAAAADSTGSSVIAEKKFELRDASPQFDVLISVAYRDDGEKLATFSFCKKGGTPPHQVIRLPDTWIDSDADDDAQGSVSIPYEQQSAVRVGDFNFDGREDVALCDGTNANYGALSYRIYLASPRAMRFVYDKRFSDLGQSMGMFDVDKEKRVLRTYWKDGYALHVTEEYAVIKNHPVKVFSEETEAIVGDDTSVKITTRRLVGGRWRAKVTFEKHAP